MIQIELRPLAVGLFLVAKPPFYLLLVVLSLLTPFLAEVVQRNWQLILPNNFGQFTTLSPFDRGESLAALFAFPVRELNDLG